MFHGTGRQVEHSSNLVARTQHPLVEINISVAKIGAAILLHLVWDIDEVP